MRLDTELRLSYYKEIADVNSRHAVKLVQHTETGRVYVLKKLTVYDMRVFAYLAEHRIEGIPRIEELIEDDGVLYVAEEYVSGATLRERLTAEGKLSTEEAVKTAYDICCILEPLHALTPPIVHRDIKPENIIISSDGRTYLVDFDSAKECGGASAHDTVLMGTAGYAAPEQYGFAPSLPSADVYAMGVLINEMLTGRLPNEEPCGGQLSSLTQRCIKMEPSARYASAAELKRALSSQMGEIRSERSRLRAWLPPGFRSRNPFLLLLGALWYVFFISLSLSLVVKGSSIAINRFFCLLMFLSETIWLGNYRNIWSKMPLTRSDNLLLKLLGAVVWGALLIFLLLVLLAIFA